MSIPHDRRKQHSLGMGNALGLVAVLSSVAGCTYPRDAVRPAHGGTELAPDAHGVVERLAGCTHFASEINGDGSARDREVFAAMGRLHCETIDRDVALIRRKYADDVRVQQALDVAGEL